VVLLLLLQLVIIKVHVIQSIFIVIVIIIIIHCGILIGDEGDSYQGADLNQALFQTMANGANNDNKPANPSGYHDLNIGK
jgi:hypothetical protein